MQDHRLYAPAAARNREPLLEALRVLFPTEGLVLELASGSGEHAVFFASALPQLVWLPSDTKPEALASIDAHRQEAGLGNLCAALALDVTAAAWPVDEPVDAMLCVNMIHIAPWHATEGLFAGAQRHLRQDGRLVLYGPFSRGGLHSAPSNEAFDRSLRAQDPAWGVRDLDEVEALALRHALQLADIVPMPSNNLSVCFKKA